MRWMILILGCLFLSCDAKAAPTALPPSPISPADTQSWKDIRKKAKEAQVLGKTLVLSPSEQTLLGRLHAMQKALKPEELLVHGRVVDDNGKSMPQAQIWEQLDKGTAYRAKLVTLNHSLAANGSFLLKSEAIRFGADFPNHGSEGFGLFPEIDRLLFANLIDLINALGDDLAMSNWDQFVAGETLILFNQDDDQELDSRINRLAFDAKTGLPSNAFIYDFTDNKFGETTSQMTKDRGLVKLPLKTDLIKKEFKHLPADLVQKLRAAKIDVEWLVEKKALCIICLVTDKGKIEVAKHSIYKDMEEGMTYDDFAEKYPEKIKIVKDLREKLQNPSGDLYPKTMTLIAFGEGDGFIEKREYKRGYGAPCPGKQLRQAPENGYKNVWTLGVDDLAVSNLRAANGLYFYLKLNGKYGRGRISGGLNNRGPDEWSQEQQKIDPRGLTDDNTRYIMHLPMWIQPDGSRKLQTGTAYE